MAPTSDERREVAARLRERPVARNIKESYVAIVQAVGVRPCLLSHEGESGDRFDAAAYAEVLDRLADLIDPTCHAEQDYDRDEPIQGRWWKCEKCGEYFVYERGFEPSFCPYCGARVIGNGNE